MRLYFQVDLTGNLIMNEKLVLGEIWIGDLSIFKPDALTSAPSRQANEDEVNFQLLGGYLGSWSEWRTACSPASDPRKVARRGRVSDCRRGDTGLGNLLHMWPNNLTTCFQTDHPPFTDSKQVN